MANQKQDLDPKLAAAAVLISVKCNEAATASHAAQDAKGFALCSAAAA